jgi:hypothetical protein
VTTPVAGSTTTSVPAPAPARHAEVEHRAGGTGARHEGVRATAVASRTPSTTPVALTRTFTLGPTPKNVDVYLDGEKQFAYDTDHKSITVPWSSDHVIEFRSPAGCCFVEKIEVGPDRPLPADAIIARRLKWKPAHLAITTDPPDPRARIVIHDPNRAGTGMVARAGEEMDIPFFADDEASKEIDIAVDTGDAFTSERVSVRAGQRTTHVVTLKGANPQ